MPKPQPTVCIEPGCDQPRYVNPKGTVLTRCHEHQKQFWREAQAARVATGRRPEAARANSPRRLPALPAIQSTAEAAPIPAAPPHHEGVGVGQDCTCPDCIYREVIALLAARHPRIEELVQTMLAARRLRDDLGI